MTEQKERDHRRLESRRNLLKRLIQVAMQIGLFGVLLFVSAGRLVWYWAWIYLGCFRSRNQRLFLLDCVTV